MFRYTILSDSCLYICSMLKHEASATSEINDKLCSFVAYNLKIVKQKGNKKQPKLSPKADKSENEGFSHCSVL